MKCNKEYRLSFTRKAKEIVQDLTLGEKVHLMSGQMTMEDLQAGMSGMDDCLHYNVVPYGAGGSERHNLSAMLFCDGPRGVVCGTGRSTCFPVSMLRGFARVELLPGESKDVSINCPIEEFKWYNPATAAWELEHMDYGIYIGNSSANKDLLAGTIAL
ncbi:MAG: fibronectin type III-like domain-contianing protein [Anaerolineaceae bacterium]